jgi:DNA repair exonuclease SbcCD ATPase subunit
MERLIEERNKVVVEEQVVNVEIVKYLPKLVEKVVYKKGITEQLEVELNGLRNNLKVIIEQYNNLKNIEKEYIYKAIEIPYETVKYVERPIEVFKIDQEKVINLERELERLRAVEIEIKAKIDEVQIQKNTTIKRRKNVLTEKIKTIERPIKTLRVSNDKMVDLEKQLNDAQIELTNWQKRCEQYDIIKEKIIEVPHEVIKEVEYPVEVVKADDELVKNLAMSLSSIKAAMTGIEIKHELLSEQQNEVIERIVEKPKKIEREVEREINVVKFDSEKVNFLNEQIKGLKSNLSQRRKEFNNYERNRNITEERSFYEEEVIRLIQRPVELLTLDKKAQREIQRQFDKAYGLLEQWRIRYRELLDEKYTPEEKYIEVPVEKKKFAVSKVEIMKPDENDIKRLEIEIEKMNTDILSFQSKISEVQTSLKHTIINEKIIEVAKETVIEVEKPTHFYTMDNESVRELRNELKTLRTTVTSTINRRY